MRDVSCRPVRSEDDTLTGAPRCSRMLTFRSRSIPDTCRGDVFAKNQKPQTKHHQRQHQFDLHLKK